MYFIKEMPISERPRERLYKEGVNKLTNVELLAILLQTGTKKMSVIELSKHIIYQFQSIANMKDLTIHELLKIEGIGMAKATTILAALELSKRIAEQTLVRNMAITHPFDVYHHYKHKLIGLDQEHFYCLYLDTKHQIIEDKLIFIGTLNQSVIHPREVFRHGIRVSCYGVIFIHNHPSGDATPSQADLKATHQLEVSGQMMGIQVVDHIIIGKNECFSIKENRKYHL